METIIYSGVPRKELESWLETVGTGDRFGCFTGADWQVYLGSEVRVQSGSLVLSRTTVVFQGEAVTCTRLVAAFRLKFLSAGG